MTEPSKTPRVDANVLTFPLAGGNHQFVFAQFAREQLERPLVALGMAIACSAVKAGIYNGDAPVGGAQLVQLCDDMASEIERLRASISEERKRVREIFTRRLNLTYDQRAYSWHEIQDALSEVEAPK